MEARETGEREKRRLERRAFGTREDEGEERSKRALRKAERPLNIAAENNTNRSDGDWEPYFW
jgi:hypothetical protein